MKKIREFKVETDNLKNQIKSPAENKPDSKAQHTDALNMHELA